MQAGESELAVGFVGLGDMGAPIAERILEQGFSLTAYDIRAEAMDQLVARGASSVQKPSELAAVCNVIFICVVNDQQALALVRDHFAGSLREGTVLVVLSSIRPETMRELQDCLPYEADGNGAVLLLDSPVSGSRPAAAAGALTLMIGGDPGAVERIKPVLEAFSERIFLTGALGSGQAMKIANNLMLHMNHLVALEAVRFARAQGISEQALIEVANYGTARSWVTETWGLIDQMFQDHPQAGTSGIYDMMVKEMWNAIMLARDSGTWLPLTGLGVQVGRLFHKERERDLGLKQPDDVG